MKDLLQFIASHFWLDLLLIALVIFCFVAIF